MRLNKFLAKAGIASRRQADTLIEEGHVSVNGEIVTQLGTQVNENQDVVKVDGKLAQPSDTYIYLILHKPVGYMVTRIDEFGRATVMELVGKYRKIVKPVGRLDLNSSGLLLFTNDGELAFRLTHPRFTIDKTYQVKCEGLLSDEEVDRIEKGVMIEGGITSPAKIKIISQSPSVSRFEITIHEGRKRQVRLMCQAVKHEVVFLKRISFGNLELGDLKSGKYRLLEAAEVKALKATVNL
jgi:23S rRNA pseudouridine2605 synthase